MNAAAYIERIDAVFRARLVRSLPSACAEAEVVILDTVVEEMIAVLERHFRTTVIHCDNDILLLDGRPFTIRHTPDPVDARAIAITCEFKGLGVPRVQATPRCIPLPEVARYNRCDLYCPDDIAETCGLDLAEVIAGSYTVATRALSALVQEALSSLGSDLAHSLHARVREVLPAEVASQVYLYFLTDAESMYLGDAVHVARTIDAAAVAIENSGPPLLAICEFYDRILKPDDTAAAEVLR